METTDLTTPTPAWDAGHSREAVALAAALDTHLRTSASGIDRLQHAVHDFARRARRDDAAPQQLLLAVKAIFRAPAYSETGGLRVEMLLERAVTWAIRAYYAPADDAGQDAPPRSPAAATRPTS